MPEERFGEEPPAMKPLEKQESGTARHNGYEDDWTRVEGHLDVKLALE